MSRLRRDERLVGCAPVLARLLSGTLVVLDVAVLALLDRAAALWLAGFVAAAVDRERAVFRLAACRGLRSATGALVLAACWYRLLTCFTRRLPSFAGSSFSDAGALRLRASGAEAEEEARPTEERRVDARFIMAAK